MSNGDVQGKVQEALDRKEMLIKLEKVEQISQQVGQLDKKVGELNGTLGEVKKGLYCDPSGHWCFQTPQELNDFMEKQSTKIDVLDGKIGDVAARIKELGQPQKPAAEGATEPRKKWREMSTEERQALVQEIESLGYPHPAYYELVRQCSVSGKKDACDMLKPALKQFSIQEILAKLPEDKQRGITAFVCKDGSCKPLREGMEKEEGVRIYTKDKRGKWHWVDEPELEGSHF